MSKLTRQEVMNLTAEERVAYNKRRNAERVAKHRRENREHAMEYNKTYKKDYVNRKENKEKYDELNRQYVNKHNKQKREKKEKAISTLTDAIKARKARMEMNMLKEMRNAKQTLTDAMKARKARAEIREKAVNKANETANKLQGISKSAKEIIKKNKKVTVPMPVKKTRGRPRKTI